MTNNAAGAEAVPEPTAQPAPGRSKRQRSVTETLLSIVLTLEAVLVFFVTLVVFGLDITPPAVAFAGGGALIVVLVLGARFVRWPWGVWFGWVLQLLIVATGILVPLMYLIAAMFLAIWIYCFVRGRQIDRRNAIIETQMREDNLELPADHTENPNRPNQGDTP